LTIQLAQNSNYLFRQGLNISNLEAYIKILKKAISDVAPHY